MQRAWSMSIFLMLSAVGCASLESTVRTRAAHDFHCSEDQLRVLDQEQTVFRIAGCGEEATYVCNESRSFHVHCKRAEWEDRAQL